MRIKNSYFLYGASGHGKVVADIIEKSGGDIIGFIDDNMKIHGNNFFGYKVLGGMEKLFELYSQEHRVIIAIGNNTARKKISLLLGGKNIRFGIAIHPAAEIGKGVFIGEGTVVMANAVINSAAIIGKHCIINSASSIDHDGEISDFVHISPKAVLGGNVKIGELAWLGLGALIRNNISIGENSVVGMGSVVLHDIGDGIVVAGNPAKILREI